MMIATMRKKDCYEVRFICTNKMFTKLSKVDGRIKQLCDYMFIAILPLQYLKIEYASNRY